MGIPHPLQDGCWTDSIVLTYSSGTMIPRELEVSTYRRLNFDPKANEKLLNESLDLIDKKHEEANMSVVANQWRFTRQYNIWVKNIEFNIGYLVFKQSFQHLITLGPNWWESYTTKNKISYGTYKLASINWDVLPRAWNNEHLHGYF